jgi:hypothetical protein
MADYKAGEQAADVLVQHWGFNKELVALESQKIGNTSAST